MTDNPQNQTFWQRAKEFAGSNLGRNLIGGLGSGLAVALSGGDGRDVLRYGLQGAAATTNAINRRNLYNDRMARDELERADRLAEAEKRRQFQMKMLDNQINANKELADINFRNALAEIDYNNMAQANAEEAERQRKIQNIQNNPYLSEQQKSWQVANIDGGFDKDAYFTDVLLQDPQNAEALSYFKNKQALTALTNYMTPQEQLKLGAELAKGGNLMLDPEALNSGQIRYIQKTQTPSELQEKINFLQQAGYNSQQIVDSLGLGGTASEKEKYAFQKGVDLQNAIAVENAKAQNAQNLENIKYGNQLGLEGVKFDYGQQGADAQMLRDMRTAEFKNSLPTETQREITAQANALGIPESAIYQGMYDEQQLKIQQALSNIAKNQSDIARTNAEIPYIGQQAQANLNKTLAETQKTQQELANLQNPSYDPHKKIREEMAKDYVEDVTNYRSMVSKLPELEDVVNKLDKLADDVTYTYFGQAMDFLAKQFLGKTTTGSKAREEYKALVNNQVLPLLRDTFGAQFTEKEGERLLQTFGDLNATPEEKKEALKAILQVKINDIKSLEKKIESYGFNQDLGISPILEQTPTDNDAWGDV